MRPEWFTTDPESDSADKCWKHWWETFTNFIEVLHSERPVRPINKRALLTNYLSHIVNEITSDCVTYEEAIDVLNATYIKPKSEIFSRYLIATCRQESGEILDHFFKSLRTPSKDYWQNLLSCLHYKNVWYASFFFVSLGFVPALGNSSSIFQGFYLFVQMTVERVSAIIFDI